MQKIYDVGIIGGGFFGVHLALTLAARGKRVVLCEREEQLLSRASYNNQARVHGGYHYPRSLITGLRSQQNYAAFFTAYRECIESSHSMYYAIAKKFSKVSAPQFVNFCQRIGASLRPAPKSVARLFCPEMIEEVFAVEESAFNVLSLREILVANLNSSSVEVLTKTFVEAVDVKKDLHCLKVSDCGNTTRQTELLARNVFLCTYASLNHLLHASSLPQIPLRHEMAELALVEPPEELNGFGLTVMCGPFFSLMPFPARQLYSLSHVRYTPHYTWLDQLAEPGHAVNGLNQVAHQLPASVPTTTSVPKTNFLFMRKDAERYLPIMKDCLYRNSLWETKTVLPRNELDDSRPILFKKNHGVQYLHCIIGGKIDNVLDMTADLNSLAMR